MRYFLAFGMLGSGILVMLFGAAHYLSLHSVWYFVLVQVLSGVLQTTGWPGVVTVMANWFGKGKRGLIMGIWNSHNSLGNILGALLAGHFVNTNWGQSFTVPGLLMCLVSLVIFLFLVPEPSVIGMTPPKQQKASVQSSPESPVTGHPDTEKGLRRSPSSSRLIDSAYESDGDAGGSSANGSGKAISFTAALKIPGVVEFSLCLFFAKLVSYTFLFWLPNYISTTSGLDARSSAKLSTFFDVGGIMGGIIAGLVSDHSGMSASTCGVMLVLAIPVMCLYQVMAGAWCMMSQVSCGFEILDLNTTLKFNRYTESLYLTSVIT